MAITAWVVDLSQWSGGWHGPGVCHFIKAFATVGQMDDNLFQAGDRRIFCVFFFFGGGRLVQKTSQDLSDSCKCRKHISFHAIFAVNEKVGGMQGNHTITDLLYNSDISIV